MICTCEDMKSTATHDIIKPAYILTRDRTLVSSTNATWWLLTLSHSYQHSFRSTQNTNYSFRSFIGRIMSIRHYHKRLSVFSFDQPGSKELSDTDEAEMTGNSIYDVSNADGASVHGQSLKHHISTREKVVVSKCRTFTRSIDIDSNPNR